VREHRTGSSDGIGQDLQRIPSRPTARPPRLDGVVLALNYLDNAIRLPAVPVTRNLLESTRSREEDSLTGPSERHQLAIAPSLIADVGATNVRLALVGADSGFQRVRVLSCKDYASIQDAIGAYLDDELRSTEMRRVKAAALAIAAPVRDDQVTLTNHPWSFSKSGLRQELALERLHVVNDFTAVAVAIPHLTPDDCNQIGGGTALASAPIGVIGPGSGLGVGGLVSMTGGWLPLSGEGGHVTMMAATARESAVLDRMRERFDHVSAERILSGPGLVNLYTVLAEMGGAPAAPYTSAQITDPLTGERDQYCRETVDMFCAMLGTIAGNLALTLGALGGIYIAGGIVPKLGMRFSASTFREQFENKGRMRPYLARIPTYVVTHPFPAFLGLAKLLAD
jgi:glucokinase